MPVRQATTHKKAHTLKLYSEVLYGCAPLWLTEVHWSTSWQSSHLTRTQNLGGACCRECLLEKRVCGRFSRDISGEVPGHVHRPPQVLVRVAARCVRTALGASWTTCPRAGWVSMLLLESLREQCSHPAQGRHRTRFQSAASRRSRRSTKAAAGSSPPPARPTCETDEEDECAFLGGLAFGDEMTELEPEQRPRRRPPCSRCGRPGGGCVCALLPPAADRGSRMRIVVLYHSVRSPPNNLDKGLPVWTWRLRGLYAKIRGSYQDKSDRVGLPLLLPPFVSRLPTSCLPSRHADDQWRRRRRQEAHRCISRSQIGSSHRKHCAPESRIQTGIPPK